MDMCIELFFRVFGLFFRVLELAGKSHNSVRAQIQNGGQNIIKMSTR